MKKLLKKAAHDFNNRDMAIVYIDGEVYEDSTHAICLQKYLNDTGQGNIKNFKDRPEVEIFSEISKEHGGQDVILAHRVDNADSIYYIYGLDDGKEMSDNKIIYLLGDAYPNYEIINDLEHDEEDNHGYDEEMQTNKSTRRISEFSLKNYKNVIESNGLKIDLDDNYIYNEYVGFELIPESQVIIPISIIPIYDENSNFDLDEIEDLIKELIPECKPVYEMVAKLGYVFDETELLYGSSFSYIKELNDGSSIILNSSDQGFEFEFKNFSSDKKEQLKQMGIEEKISFYPNELEEKTKTIEGLIQQGGNKMKRLKTAVHDWNNRDTAIVYIGGAVYEDATHGICLKRYFQDNNMDDEDVYLGTRPEVEQFSEVSKLNGGQEVILAHRVDKADAIYFIYGLNNGAEMSDEQIKSTLKGVYPDYEIINDLEHDSTDNHGYDEEMQVEKGRERIDEFELGDLGESLERIGYEKMSVEDGYFNGYSTILCDDYNKTFKVNTMLDIGMKGESFGYEEFDDIIRELRSELGTIYDQLLQYGFELDDEFLEDEDQFFYFATTNSGILGLCGGRDNFSIDLEQIDDEAIKQIKSIGLRNNDYVTMEELAKVISICDGETEANLKFRLKKKGN